MADAKPALRLRSGPASGNRRAISDPRQPERSRRMIAEEAQASVLEQHRSRALRALAEAAKTSQVATPSGGYRLRLNPPYACCQSYVPRLVESMGRFGKKSKLMKDELWNLH